MNTRPGWIFISNVNKASEFEWLADYAAKDHLPIRFILFNSKDSHLHKYLLTRKFPCEVFSFSSKWVLPPYVLYFFIRLLLGRPAFVHAHLFEAGLVALPAAWLAGIRKRLYTRHHSTLHHTYHPGAVKYDRLINFLSTHIVAVSTGVKKVLVELEGTPESKIFVIPHGMPGGQLKSPDLAEVESLRIKYRLSDSDPVIGVVSRFVEWKGVQYIIPAFKKLLEDRPRARLVLANASGNYSNQIHALLQTLPQDSYVLIAHEENMSALFRCFDVFVHVPVDAVSEAFGQVYLEAFMLEVPVVCTVSGVANELVRADMNALLVPYRNSEAIYEQVKRVLTDEQLRLLITTEAKKDAAVYSFEKKYQLHKQLYLS